MTVYYNEFDPFAAAWLRNLIAAGHIPAGDVDERDIREVQPHELEGYVQCHFFAGIGGWSLALRLAGWPDDQPVWTGSAPCPPWSRARIWHIERAGEQDERDLWPEQHRLLEACRPRVFFGEQVSGKRAEPWVDRLRRDFEGIGYECQVEKKLACDVGAPIRRERNFIAAERLGQGGQGLVTRRSAGAAGPWGWRGQEDLRAISEAPFVDGDRWPKPLLRRMDDGLSTRVERLRAYGNAIVPQVAAEFIMAFEEAKEDTQP